MYRTWFAQGQVCRVWLALRLETQPSLQEDAGPTDVPAGSSYCSSIRSVASPFVMVTPFGFDSFGDLDVG